MQDDGFSGNVKLDVIGIAVEVETMLTYVVTKEEQVEDAGEDQAASPEGGGGGVVSLVSVRRTLSRNRIGDEMRQASGGNTTFLYF